jgi:uncharacterized membrane protein
MNELTFLIVVFGVPAITIICICIMSRLRSLEQKINELQQRGKKKKVELAPSPDIVNQALKSNELLDHRPPAPSKVVPAPPAPPPDSAADQAETPLLAVPWEEFVAQQSRPTKQDPPSRYSDSATKAVPMAESPDLRRSSENAVTKIKDAGKSEKSKLSWEQRIGSQWMIVAGIIVILFAAGFFLKYVYDQSWVPPWGRVMIVALTGFIALGVGEWTRRRDYGIAARGLTALGFAILYAAVFSAHGFHDLINMPVAILISICITAGAMTYAVRLNEILIAFLGLLGGYLSPLILIHNQDKPNILFAYLTILCVGSFVCAALRKWRSVNQLTFFGTFILYAVWFFRFYPAPSTYTSTLPENLPIAVSWLAVFFYLFLGLPIIYGIVHQAQAQKKDVQLLISNAAITWAFCIWFFTRNTATPWH